VVPLELLLGAFKLNTSKQRELHLSRARRSAAPATQQLMDFTAFCTSCSHK